MTNVNSTGAVSVDPAGLPDDVMRGLQALSQGKSAKVVTIGGTVQIRGSDTTDYGPHPHVSGMNSDGGK